jgi:nucleoid DNA-binding protein
LRTSSGTANNSGALSIIRFQQVHSLSEKTMAKKSGKSEAPIRAIKETLTKSALINLLAEQNEISRKTAVGVFNTLEAVMLGSIHPRGAGEFTLPGLLKIILRKVPARKAGTMVRNPGTGEMMAAAAKPATVRVKVRALSKLKKAAVA